MAVINFPDNPFNGQKFVASNDVEYTYNSTNDSWTGALEAGSVPINPDPDEVTADPAFGTPAGTNGGSGTESDPYIITTETVLLASGEKTSEQYITVTDGKAGDIVQFTNITTLSQSGNTNVAPKFDQPPAEVDGDGNWRGTLKYNDNVGGATTSDSTYVGKLRLGSSSVYFQWTINQGAANPLVVDTAPVVTADTQPTIVPGGNTLNCGEPTVSGGVAPYTYAYQWQSSSTANGTYSSVDGATTNSLSVDPITTQAGNFYRCQVIVSDSSSFTTLTETTVSNSLNVVELRASVNGYSDPSDPAPAVGQDLDAAESVTGNKVAYSAIAWQWYQDDVVLPSATSRLYKVRETDVGKTLSVKITCGAIGYPNISATSLPTKPCEQAAGETVDTPTLLTPVNGAGTEPLAVGAEIPTTGTILSVANSGTDTTLTFTDETDLDILGPGDALMTNASGVVQTYSPRTSYIKTVTDVGNDTNDEWNQSAEWSTDCKSYKTAGGNVFSDTNTQPLFNGELQSGWQSYSSTQLIGIQFDMGATAPTATSQVGIYWAMYGSDTFNWAIGSGNLAAPTNLTTVETSYQGIDNYVLYHAYQDYTGTVNTITVQNTTPDGFAPLYIVGITVDEKLLVDQSIPSNSDGGTTKLLNFVDGQDLQYFQYGDVIQDAPWNQSQVWSDYLTSNIDNLFADGQGPTNAFNGDNNDQANPDASYGNLIFNPVVGIAYDTSVEVLTGGNYDHQFALNGISGPVIDGGGYDTWFTVATGSGTLNRLVVAGAGNGYPNLKGIRVDGKVLVDTGVQGEASESVTVLNVDVLNNSMILSGGAWSNDGDDPKDPNWNQSEIWSANPPVVIENTNYAAINPIANMYSNKSGLSSGAATSGLAQFGITSGRWTQMYKNKVLVSTSVVVFYNVNADSDEKCSVSIYDANGNSVTKEAPVPSGGNTTIGSLVWTAAEANNYFTGIQLYSPNASKGLYIAGIQVDDVTLIDATAPTSVTGPSNTGTGTVKTVDVGTKTVVLEDSNGHWVSSGAYNAITGNGNADGTSFYLTGDEVDPNAAVDPDNVTMTSTKFSGTDSSYGTSTWEIGEETGGKNQSNDEVFILNSVVNVTNTSQDIYKVSTITPETSKITKATLKDNGNYQLEFLEQNNNLYYFENGEQVSSVRIPPEIQADMSGMRTDFDRLTKLQTSFLQDSKVGTFSIWVKVTSFEEANENNPGIVGTIFGSLKDAGLYFELDVQTDGTLLLSSNGTTGYSANGLTLNTWHNIVFAFGKTTAEGGGVWIDNVPAGNAVAKTGITTVTDAIANSQNSIIFADCLFQVMGYPNSNYPQILNGYSSACYFVEGQVLPPSVFGYTNAGSSAWAPRTPAEIEANIDYRFAAQAPYDTRPYMEADWAATVPGGTNAYWSGDFKTENAFNGDLTNFWIPRGNDTAINWVMTDVGLTDIPFTKTVEFLLTCGASGVGPAGVPNAVISGVTVALPAVANMYGQWVTAATGSGTFGGFTNFSANAAGNNYSAIGAIKIDGRFMIDGPADNSQMWSDGMTSVGVTTPLNLFNGVIPAEGGTWQGDTYTYSSANNTSTSLTNISIPTSTSGTIRVMGYATLGSGGFTINGETNYKFNVDNVAEWITISQTTINTITFENSVGSGDLSGTVYLAGIEQNGELLIDSGEQWNTSAVWSDNLTSTGTVDNDSPSRMFDGDTSTGVTPAADKSVSWNIGQANKLTGKLEVYLTNGAVDAANPETVLTINGSNSSIDPNTHNEWQDTGLNEFYSFVSSNVAGSYYCRISAWRVDGKILVDNVPFGANGFYLPFNPDAVGVDYTSGTITGSPYSGQYGTNPWHTAFNANLINGASGSGTDESNKYTLNFPNLGITFDTLSIYVSNNTSTIWVNDTAILTSGATLVSSGLYSLPVTSEQIGSSQLQSLAILSTVTILGVVVDGNLLVNHNNIGVDASGNNKNFYNQNFAVGNTSQVWSEYSNYSGGWLPGDTRPKSFMFNNFQDEGYNGYGVGGTAHGGGTSNPAILTFPTPLTDVYSLQVIISADGNQTAAYNSETPLAVPASMSQQPFTLYSSNTPTTVSSVQFTSSNDGGNTVYGIVVNGEILIDANIQDTVIDTPVTDYAVLLKSSSDAALSNGNLQATGTSPPSQGAYAWAQSSLKMPANSGKYYAEVTFNSTDASSMIGVVNSVWNNTTNQNIDNMTLVGLSSVNANYSLPTVPLGILFDSNTATTNFLYDGSVYPPSGAYLPEADWYKFMTADQSSNSISQTNYGQQPFLYATNNMDGTCEVPATYNTSSEWSSQLTAGASGFNLGSDAIYAFDGSTTTGAASAPDESLTFTNTFGLSGKVRVYTWIKAQSTSDCSISVDGGTPIETNVSSDNYGWFNLGDIGAFTTIQVNGQNGAAAYIRAIEVNGTMLVDSTLWNASQTWSSKVSLIGGAEALNEASKPWVYAFDGSSDNYGALKSNAKVGDKVEFDFTGYNLTATRITMRGQVPAGTGIGMIVNDRYEDQGGDTGRLMAGDTPFAGEVYVDFGTPTPISKIGWGIIARGSNGPSGAYWFKIDDTDVILVDQGGGTFFTLVTQEADALSLDTVTGTVAAVDIPNLKMDVTPTNNSDWTGTEGHVVTGEEGTGLKKNTTYRARMRHTSQNQVQSSYSNVNRFKTASDAPGPTPPGPDLDYDASGLRFSTVSDKNLSRTPISTSIKTTTFSFWAKFDRIDDENTKWIFAKTGSNWRVGITKAVLRWDSGNGKVEITIPEANTWYHICLRQRNAEGIGYLNGAQQDMTVSMTVPFSGDPITIGAFPGPSGGFNGYLSEVYMVEGQALEPSVFAEDINGVWTPRANTDIVDDIGVEGIASPYDTRLDVSEKWSDNLTGSSTVSNPKYAFDGNPETAAEVPVYGSSITYTGTLTGVNTLRLKLQSTGSSGESMTVSGTGIVTTTIPALFTGFQPIKLAIPGVNVSDINIQVGPGTYARLAAVEVNGHILADGPANNSQDWGANSSWTASSVYEFNDTFSNSATGGVVFDVPTAITGASSIALKITLQSDTLDVSNTTVKIDGASIDNTGAWAYDTGTSMLNITTVPASFNKLEVTGAGTYSLYSVKIDDVQLIDSGAQWNTSEVWSDGLQSGSSSILDGYPVTRAFDGNPLTACASAGDASNPVSINFNNVSFTTLQINATYNETTGGTGSFKINGTDVTSAFPAGTGGSTTASTIVDVTSLVTSPLTNISFYGGNPLAEVIVDGKTLVNNTPFGVNGFYLPFDPDAVGGQYVYRLSSSATFAPGATLYNTFNGDPTTWALPTSSPAIINIDPPIGKAGDKIRYIGTTGGADTISMDGQSVTGMPSGGTVAGPSAEITLSAPLSSITITGSGSPLVVSSAFAGLVLNNEILVDHNNIGVDASGNNNNFYDQNFAVGNTSEVWSKTGTAVATAGNIVGSLIDVFDGNYALTTSTGISQDTADATLVLTFDPPLPSGSVQLAMRAYGASAPPNNVLVVNSTIELGSQLNPPPGDAVRVDYVDVPGDVAVSTIAFDRIGASNYVLTLQGIIIDGKCLVDANIQDTVLDKPVTDYAVLGTVNSGLMSTNGALNLERSSNQGGLGYTNQTLGSNKYYFEATFALSGYNSGCGILNGTNTSNPAGSPATPGYYGYFAYMEDPLTYWRYEDGTRVDTGFPAATGDIMGIAFDMTPETISEKGTPQVIMYLNGEKKEQFGMTEPDNSKPYQWALATGNQDNTIIGNFGQQPFAYGDNTALDQGKVTVDNVTYNTLFTPITQSTGSGTLYFSEKLGRAVNSSQMARKFGLQNRAYPKLGIYELTEQPTYPVSHFVKEGDKYRPVRDTLSLATHLFQLIKSASSAWAGSTIYAENAFVVYNSKYYRALEAHTSTSTFDELKWSEVDFTHGSFTGETNNHHIAPAIRTVSDNRV